MRTATEQEYPPLGDEYDDYGGTMVSRRVVYSIIAGFLVVAGTAVYEMCRYFIH